MKITETQLRNLIREEMMLEVNPAFMASFTSAKNHEENEPIDAKSFPSYIKLDHVYITARKLGIEPELVSQVVDAGLLGIFKKKDPRLTPDLIKSIKSMFKQVQEKFK